MSMHHSELGLLPRKCLEIFVGTVECYVGIFVPKPREIYTEIFYEKFSVEFATVRR